MPSLFAAAFFSLPSSAPVVRLLLAAHILAGATALLAGLVPMLSRKGGRWHVGAGRTYTACMVGVAATAGLMCAVQPLTQGRLLLTGIAVFSFYLSFSGWRAARRRSVQLPTSDLLLAGVSLAVGIAMLAAGLYRGAVLFAFFGGLTCVFAGLDTWHGVRRAGPISGPTIWLLRHFTRMAGSYISAATAFVVVNLGRWLPADAPAWAGLAGWLAPTFLGSLLIFRAVRRYRAPQRPVPNVAPLAGLALLALPLLMPHPPLPLGLPTAGHAFPV